MFAHEWLPIGGGSADHATFVATRSGTLVAVLRGEVTMKPVRPKTAVKAVARASETAPLDAAEQAVLSARRVIRGTQSRAKLDKDLAFLRALRSAEPISSGFGKRFLVSALGGEHSGEGSRDALRETRFAQSLGDPLDDLEVIELGPFANPNRRWRD
jgi:hypothetical protein